MAEATASGTRGKTGLSRVLRLLGRLDLTVLLLLAVIFAVRLVWVLLVAPPALEKDSLFYHSAARWFMNSGTFAISDAMQPSAWVMPGYAFFLSIVYWLFGTGGDLIAVRVVQTLLSVLTIVVLYRVALRLQGRKLGLAVIALAGLYPPFAFANNHILTEVLYTFVLSLVVLFGVRLLDKVSWSNACIFGVLLAAAAYVRPTSTIWGVVPFLFLLGKVSFRRVAALSAIGLFAFCLCMSPWWIRNAQIYDRFVPFNTSSSDTLLVGTYVMFDAEGEDYEVLPKGVLVWSSREMQRITAQDELAADAHYKELAFSRLGDQLRNHPIKLIFGRVSATAGSFRTPYFLPSLPNSAKKATKWAQFLLVLIPAALALWANRKDRRVLLLASLPVVVGIAYATILISPRYVFPLTPLIIFMAAAGWLHCFEWASGRLRGRRHKEETHFG